ncbi:MAG TPA: MBL fold metallo-hydrolase [Tepidisphaeraceae bacterium]
MIEPLLKDEAFLADVDRTVRDRAAQLRLWWLGQSGFLLQRNGRHLLFDPYLSDSLTRKYEQTQKPHVRMTQIVVAPERLSFVDVVTSSHNHTDHLDAETLIPLLAAARHDVSILVPAANRLFAAKRLGLAPDQLLTLDAGQSIETKSFDITAVAAAHDKLETDEKGRFLYLGYVVRAGPWTVYHSGDTVVYPGMAEVLRPHGIDVAILPINGKVGNMNGLDAARLAKDMGAKLVIPCHYEMFEFNTASPEDFIVECEQIGQPFRVLRGGEGLTLGLQGDE